MCVVYQIVLYTHCAKAQSGTPHFGHCVTLSYNVCKVQSGTPNFGHCVTL